MNNYKYTIIIANYNYGRFLEECLDSIRTQTYKNYECIIVDDGSTDGSIETIEKYLPLINGTLIRQKNAGQAKAWNSAVAGGSGDLIAFLDADDRWLPHKLEIINAVYNTDQTLGLIHHDLFEINSQGSRLDGTFGGKTNATGCYLREGNLKSTILNKLNPYSWYFSPSSGLIVPKRVVKTTFPIPETFRVCADVPLAYSAALLGNTKLIKDPLGEYRLHDKSNYASLVKENSRDHWEAEQFLNTVERYIYIKSLVLNKEYELHEEDVPELKQYRRFWSYYHAYLNPNHIDSIYKQTLLHYKTSHRHPFGRMDFLDLISSVIDIIWSRIKFITKAGKDNPSISFYKRINRVSEGAKIFIGTQ